MQLSDDVFEILMRILDGCCDLTYLLQFVAVFGQAFNFAYDALYVFIFS